jgi:hypothetical protein
VLNQSAQFLYETHDRSLCKVGSAGQTISRRAWLSPDLAGFASLSKSWDNQVITGLGILRRQKKSALVGAPATTRHALP